MVKDKSVLILYRFSGRPERWQPSRMQGRRKVLPDRDGHGPLVLHLPPGVHAHAVHQRAQARQVDQGQVQQAAEEAERGRNVVIVLNRVYIGQGFCEAIIK